MLLFHPCFRHFKFNCTSKFRHWEVRALAGNPVARKREPGTFGLRKKKSDANLTGSIPKG
jgi:hypothetical protein